MKKMLGFIALISATQALATSNCQLSINERNGFGPVASLTISQPEVLAELSEKFPMNDCYQGICTFVYNNDKTEVTINFSKNYGNGHWSRGQAAQYQTFWTDNGMWFAVDNEKQAYSYLFKGGCE